MNEKELVSKLQKKDRKAQKYLYEKYSSLFYAICIRYAYSNDEADDMLQEGFIKILFNIQKYLGKGSFEGWMKRIIVNNAVNYYHGNYKYRYHHDITELRDIKSETSDIDESEFSYEELLGMIRELPQGYMQIFNLYAIEGYKHKEIAKMLNISENTSKSQYHRAKKCLQGKILEQRNNKIKK